MSSDHHRDDSSEDKESWSDHQSRTSRSTTDPEQPTDGEDHVLGEIKSSQDRNSKVSEPRWTHENSEDDCRSQRRSVGNSSEKKNTGCSERHVLRVGKALDVKEEPRCWRLRGS